MPCLHLNRTASRAETLAAEFGAQAITSLEGLSNISVIVSTNHTLKNAHFFLY